MSNNTREGAYEIASAHIALAMKRASERKHNYGPPSNPRRLNYFGHFRRGAAAKRHRINQIHEQALRENVAREVSE